ncbi:MAG: acyl-CoA dehydrogenase [Candidatus Promineifilaceae bacterium]
MADRVERATLQGWLDPMNPPSEVEMHTWLHEIQRVSAEIDPAERQTLAKLGQTIASLNQADSRCLSGEACAALDEVEDALGIISNDAVAELLDTPLLKPIVESADPSFGIDSLTELLDGEHAALRDRMRNLLSDPAFAYRHFDNHNDFRDHVLHWTQLLADQGLGALAYGEKYGGTGNIAQYMVIMEMLALHDLSLLIKFGVQFGLFGGSVQRLGTKYHHDKYLNDIGTLKTAGAFAMTEVGHGSNVRDIETTAIYDKATQEFIIHTPNEAARKTYVGNVARHGRLATVFAQLIIDDTNYGVNAFIVPIRNRDKTPAIGVEIRDNGLKMGLNGVDNGQLAFKQVRIPRKDMLNRFASVSAEGEYSSPIKGDSRRFFTMLGTLVGGRVGIALASNSVSKSALTIAIRYANRRRQFGRNKHPETLLIDYLTHQRRLIPLLANAYALDFALKHLTERFGTAMAEDMREIETLAAGLKAWASWNMTDTVQEGREACGGQGYMMENRFAALKADGDIFTTFEGDNTVLMQLVAKGRLTEFKQQFEDMKTFGLVRFIAQNAAHRLVGHNPIAMRNTSRDHLRDPDFHLDAFHHREEHLVSEVAKQMRLHIKGGKSSYEAMIAVQNDLLHLANAYIERVIFEQFSAGIEAVEDTKLQKILRQLATIFALTRIEADAGWYMEHGFIVGSKSAAIRTEINTLLYNIRHQAIHLVNAFAIPDALLAAPIAL